MKHKRQPVHKPAVFKQRLLCVAVASAFGGAVHANPTGPQVVNGQASFAQRGNTLAITNSPNAIINWQSFSIGAPETTRFLQQSVSSAVLNRVTGVDPSVILGTLQSNGKVFLINPNGVLFGKGSRIDVAGLVASTLNMSNQDFLAGRLNFATGAITAGSLKNQGTITTPSGGSVILIAPQVENSGIINAPNGDVILAAGHSVRLGDTGAPNVLVEIQAPDNQAVNVGEIVVGGGSASIYAGLISQQGVVRADSASVNEAGRIVFKATKDVTLAAGSHTSANGANGGQILVQAEHGTNLIHGEVTAIGSSGVGGGIKLLGTQVGVAGNARVDVSGSAGGGTILAGGDYKGGNAAIQNSRATYFDAAASLTADSTGAGNGGRIILWSDEVTRAYGQISAKGGATSGNGGFVETSSRGYLEVTSAPDLSAAHGIGGTWLLDPSNISVIAGTTGTGSLDSLTPGFVANADSSTVSNGVINAALDGDISVILDTSNAAGTQAGDITVSAPITKSTGTTASLTFNAHNDINISENITSTSGQLNLVLNSDQDSVGGGAINLGTATLNTNGGTIDAATRTVNITGSPTIDSAMTIGTLNMSSGTLSGTGNLTVSGAATLSGGLMTGTGSTITQGALTIDGNGINLDGGRVLDIQGGASWTAGSINLNGGGDPGSGTIVNRAGSLFNTGFDGLMFTQNFGGADDGTTALFSNAGTFAKSAGTGSTTIQNPFNNGGTIDIQAGTLALQGASTHTGGSIQGAGTIQFIGGTHDFDVASSITSGNVQLFQSAVTVNMAGTYNVSGTTAVAAGTANLTGTLTSLGAALNITGGTLNQGVSSGSVATFNQSGGTLSGTGNLTVSGASTLSGGLMTGTGSTITQGALTIDGNGINLDGGRVLDIQGGASWTAGSINLNGGGDPGSGTIVNRAGSLFNTGFDGLMFTQNFGGADDGTTALFSNAGTFAKSAGTGTTTIQNALNNSGTIDIQAGTLALQGASTHTGGSIQGAGTIQFIGGTHDFDVASSITSGNVQLFQSAVTVNMAGTYNVSGTTAVAAGTANLTGTLTSLGAALNITGGTLNQGVSSGSVATFNQSGGTLSGTGNLTVSGASTLSGGLMTGTGSTITQGALTIDGNGINLDGGRVLDIQGGASWTAGSINLNGGGDPGSGTIVNRAGSLFDTGFDGLMFTQNFGGADDGTTALFSNAGTFAKSAGTGSTTIQNPFNNGGTLNVNSGTLNLTQGGTHTGSFATAVGTTLQFGGGTHELNGASAVNSLGRLLVNGATVNTTGIVTSGGTLELQTGILNAGGAINTASYTQSAGTLSGTGNLTVSGASTLSGGLMTGTGSTITQGALTIDGNGINLDGGRVLDIQGGASWTAGSINLNGGGDPGSGTIVNRAGSLFNTGFDGLMFTQNFGGADDGTTALFSNAGTFAKSAGTGSTTIQNPFNNGGTLNVNSGTLNLTQGGTHTGSFATAVGTTLQFGGGTHELNGASAVNSLGRLLVNGATVNTTGIVTSGGTLELQTGILNAGGAINTASYTQSAGTLSGTGNLTVSGASTLSGGLMTGTGSTITQGALTIDGNGINLDGGRVLDIQGGASWTAGSINLNGGGDPGSGTIVNRAGSLFDTGFDGLMFTQNFGGADDGTTALFSNAGTFAKSAGTGSTTIQNPFNNGGTLNVNSGTLNLTQGGTHTGSFATAVGTTLQFGGGTHELNGASAVNSLGRLLVNGATVNTTGIVTSGGTLELQTGILNAGGAINTASYTQSAGTLSGTGNLTVSGASTLSGGLMTGTGSTITQGALTIDGNGINLDGGRVLDIQGGASWTAGSINLNGGGDPGSGTIVNRAGSLFNTGFDGLMFTQNFGGADDGTTALFSNAGTFAKSAGTGSTTIQNALNNSGVLNVSSGTLQITAFASGRNSGIIDLAAGATLSTGGISLINGATGIIRGTGTLQLGAGIALTNEGIIRPGASPGTLTIDGNLTLTPASLIDIEIQSPGVTAGTHFDVVHVTGAASLGGTLRATLLGGFVPSTSQNFRVLTASSVSGNFASLIPPTGFTRQINPQDVVLTFGGTTCAGTICWDNGNNNGLWTDPLNWNLDVLPGLSDVVVIDLGGGTFVVLDSGTYTIANLLAAEHLEISGGSLSVTGTSVFNGGLTVSGGAFTGSGAISANLMNLSSGSFNVVTTALINALNLTGGLVSGAGALTVNGSLIATGGQIALDEVTGSLRVLQSGDLNLGIRVTAHEVDFQTAGSVTLNNGLNAIGLVRGSVGGDLSIADFRPLQLGDGALNSLTVGGNLIARSIAGSGRLDPSCVGDSCIIVHGSVFAGGAISLYSNDIYIAPSTDPFPGSVATALGDPLVNYVMWAPSTQGTTVTLDDLADIGSFIQTPRLIFGDPGDPGAIGSLNWSGDIATAGELGSIHAIEAYATDINFNAALGSWPGSYLPASIRFEALKAINIGTADFATIMLADNQSLTLAADVDGIGGGDLTIGGGPGLTVRMGQTDLNTGSMDLSGANVTVTSAIGSSGTEVQVMGAGNQSIVTTGLLEVTSSGGGVWLSGGTQSITAGAMKVIAEGGSNSYVHAANAQTITVDQSGYAGAPAFGIEVVNNGGGEASINTEGAQTINAFNSGAVLVDAAGGNASIRGGGYWQEVTPGTFQFVVNGGQTILIDGNGANDLILRGGLGTAEISGGNQSITAGTGNNAGAISLLGGTTNGGNAYIFAHEGIQNINTAGRLNIIAGSAPGVGQGLFGCGPSACALVGNLAEASDPLMVNQIISAQGGITVTGGSAGEYNEAALFSHGSQTIDAAAGIVIQGGAGVGNYAAIAVDRNGYSQTIDFGSGDLQVLGGSSGGWSIGQIYSAGSQTIAGTGDIVISGGTSAGSALPGVDVVYSWAEIVGNGGGDPLASQNITANSISITALPGQSSSGIFTPVGVQHITTTGTATNGYGITIENIGATGIDQNGFGAAAYLTTRTGTQIIDVAQGGILIDGAGGLAVIDSEGPSQTINVAGGSINLVAGQGAAEIYFALGASQSIAADSISLNGGTQNGAMALIEAAHGTQTITTTTGLLSVTGGSATGDPLASPDVPVVDCGATSACAVVIARNGVQTIDAYGIAITGGGGVSENLATIRGDAGQNITIGDGGLTMQGGTGSGVHNYAVIETFGGDQILNFAPGATLSITGGDVGMQNYAGIWGGGSITYDYTVLGQTFTQTTTGTNSQQILGTPVISLTGGATGGGGDGTEDPHFWRGNAAFIIAETGNQTISAQSIDLTGGGGSENSATIAVWEQGGDQSVTASGSISLTGGGVQFTQAEIVNRSTGPLTINAQGSLSLVEGSGNDAATQIVAIGDTLSISADAGMQLDGMVSSNGLVTLDSAAGGISQSSVGSIWGNVLDLSADTGIDLDGTNVLNFLSASNTTTGNIDIYVESRLLAPIGDVVLNDIVNLGGGVNLTINSGLPLAYGMQSGVTYSASGSFNVSQSEMFGATVTANGAHFGGINMVGGTNTLDTGATLIDNLALSSTLSPATLTGNSSVTIANSFAWYGGTLSTTGTFVTNGSTSILRLNPNSPTVPVDAVLDTNWVNAAGAFAQYAGDGGGNLIIDPSWTITNQGQFHINPVGAATGQIQGAGATFVNQGLLAKDTAVATQMNTHVINDGGTIASNAGSLAFTDLTLQGAGQIQGVAPVQVNGAFGWTGGRIANGTVVNIDSGSATAGATKTLDGTLTSSGSLSVLDGLAGTGSLHNAGSMNVASVTIQPAVINDGLLTIQAGTGTTFGGSLTNSTGATVSIISNSSTLARLIVTGDVTNDGLINVQAGGTGATNAGFGVTTGTLTNNGTIRSSGDSGIFFNRLSGNIVNNGTLDVTESLRMDNEDHTFTQAGTVTIASGEQLFLNGNVNGTTLNLNSGLAIGTGATLRLFRATVNGPASLQNSGSVYLSGATNILTDVANTGAIIVSGNNLGNTLVNSAAGTISMISDTTTIANWSFTGDVTNNGLINLQAGGTGATNAGFGVTTGTLTNNGTIESSGNSGIFFNRLSGNLINNGTLDVADNLRMDNEGFTFMHDGTLSIASGEQLFINGGATGTTLSLDTGLAIGSGASLRLGNVTVNGIGGIANDGTMSIGADTDIAGSVTNTGTVEVRSLGNSIGSIASNTGTISVIADSGLASVDVGTGFTNNGTIEVVAAGTAAGAGFNVSTGTLTNAGTIRSRTLGGNGSNAIGASVSNTGIIDTSHDLTINGTLTIPSTATGLVVTGAGTLTLNDLTVNATNVLNQPVIGGTGRMVTNGTSQINGGQLHVDARDWSNLGSTTIAGRVTFDNGVVLTNEAPATLTLAGTNGTPLALGAGTGNAIVNAGMLDKTSTAVQTIFLDFVNSGTANVTTGILELSGNGTHAGSFAVNDAAGELRFTGGTHSFGAAAFSGPGLVRVNGATLDIGSATVVSNPFTLQAGSVTGAGELTLDGAFTLSGGTLSGTGALVTNGTTAVNGGTAILDGRAWNNLGAMSINGRLTLDNGAVLTNELGATLTVTGTNAAPITQGAGLAAFLVNDGTQNMNGAINQTVDVVIDNNGLLKIGLGTVTIGNFVSGTNDGTLNIAAGTTLSTDNNNLINASTGIIEGNGTLDLGGAPHALTNRGTIRAGTSPGTLTIKGDLALTSTSVMDFELGGTGAGQFDVVNVTGAALLDGSANIILVPGFAPVRGDSFHVLDAGGGVTGKFATWASPADATFAPTYGINSVTFDLAALINRWVAFSGTWTDINNWSLKRNPVATDDVVIDVSGSTETVTIDSGTHTVASLATEESLSIAGGSDLSVTNGFAAGSLATVTVASGTLSLSGTSSVAGTLSLNGGALSGDGNLDVGGQFSWTGGTVSGAGAFTAGSAQFSGGRKQLDGRSMTINGALNFGGVDWLDMSNGAVLTVNGLATLNTSAISSSFFGINSISVGADSTANLLGGINKLGAQPFVLAIQTNTAGTVRSRQGQLGFDEGFSGPGSSTHTGTRFVADAGAEISFSRGTHIVDGDVSFAGAGQTHIWANGTTAQFLPASGGGTLTNNGLLLIDSGATLGVDLNNAATLTFGNSTVSGNLDNQGTINLFSGTTNLSGNLSSAGTGSMVHVNGGTLSGTGSVTASELDLSSGSLNGTGSLTVSSNFTQSGGNLGGNYQQLALAHQGDFLVQQQSYSAQDTLTLAASGSVIVDGQTLSAPNVILFGGNGVTLRSSTSAQSLVDATTSLNVNTPSLVLDGTNGPAKLQSAGTMDLIVGSVNVTAGTYAASIDPAILNVSATGNIVLTGGSGNNASATISGNDVTVTGANITLTGGNGANSLAVIEATSGNAIVTASDLITMNAGTGANADASMGAPQGTLTITASSCTGCIALATDPLADPGTNQGLFGNSIVLILPSTPSAVASTTTEIGNSIIQATSLAAEGGDANAASQSKEEKEQEKQDKETGNADGGKKEDEKTKAAVPACM